MSALIVWTVLSVGFGMAVASQPGKSLARDILSGLAAACLVWALGFGIWEVVAWIM